MAFSGRRTTPKKTTANRAEIVMVEPARVLGSTPVDENVAFLERLTHYRDLTRQTLKQRLPSKEPRRHLYDLISEWLEGSGKGLRPALCLATCRAFGGRTEDSLDSAAAIEVLHNAFLVHDDIEDGSEFRHARPTMHRQYGIPLALNTGDAMQALSIRLLRRNVSTLGPEVAWQVADEFDHMLMESLEGQAMELGWIRDNKCDISESDYLRMILKKTCWYSFIHPIRIGALIARPGELDLDRFNGFGYFLGAAFQIGDDILNLLGSRERYGKEIGGDLYEGKRTLMLSHLFEQGSLQDKRKLQDLLGRPRQRRLPREIDWVYEILRKYRSIEFAQGRARELLDAAEKAFKGAFEGAPESDDKTFLERSVRYMIDRRS
jgi:geranylgeranyl diphosphate synthase type II